MSSSEVDLPRLIVVTNDDVVARPDFMQRAASIMKTCGPRAALQLRSRALTAAALYDMAVALQREAQSSGAMLFVNTRIDVALASGAAGVQLGRDAIPVGAAQRVAHQAGRGLRIGASVHSAAEAAQAAADGADLVILGTIWASSSHPDCDGSGVALVAEAAAVCPVPVYAIGGVTPQRAAESLEAGAYGVAVLSAVWDAADAAAEAMVFLEAMQVVS